MRIAFTTWECLTTFKMSADKPTSFLENDLEVIEEKECLERGLTTRKALLIRRLLMDGKSIADTARIALLDRSTVARIAREKGWDQDANTLRLEDAAKKAIQKQAARVEEFISSSVQGAQEGVEMARDMIQDADSTKDLVQATNALRASVEVGRKLFKLDSPEQNAGLAGQLLVVGNMSAVQINLSAKSQGPNEKVLDVKNK